MDRIYWAAVEPDELPSKVTEKADSYYQTLRQTGRLELWRKAYRHYYGLDDKGRPVASRPQLDGQQGELIAVKASHYRNLATHLINLTCQSRPSWEARSENTDHGSQTACLLGQQVLDWYMREKGLEGLFRRAVEIAVGLSAESYMVYDWDQEKGDTFALDPMTGRDVKKGDLDIRAFHAVDVIREFFQDEDSRPDWHIVKRKVSRFKLAAQYPHLQEEILNLEEEGAGATDIDDVVNFSVTGETDRVTVYYLYHDKAPQLETGRRAVVAGDLVLDDGPFPFKKYNVHRLSTGDQLKTPYAYTSVYDVMGVNDIIDMLYSAVSSNNRTFAIQNVWTQPGSGLKVSDLGGGLKHWESATKPEAVQLTASSPEAYKLIEILERLCETLSGVNSVARGSPDGALKGSSGAAMALLQSMAVQFASGLQQSYSQLVEAGGDTAIAILQTHAQVERLASIAGKHNISYAKEFSGAKLEPISKVVVDMGNPAARTSSGRLSIADTLLQHGSIDAEQYMQVLSTGKLEPVTEGKMAQVLLVKRENEALKDGKPVVAIMTDRHSLHIEEHAAILSDPETRTQDGIVQAVLGHIQEHLDLARSLPPDLAMLTGQEPLPQLPPPPPGPGMGPGPAPNPGEGPVAPPPTEGAMPGMPTNPMTGEQAPAPMGPAA
jgi:hypothetical protein